MIKTKTCPKIEEIGTYVCRPNFAFIRRFVFIGGRSVSQLYPHRFWHLLMHSFLTLADKCLLRSDPVSVDICMLNGAMWTLTTGMSNVMSLKGSACPDL
ncbi:hypothetical protein L596_022321 [Steinernema carpocapsae]|uniref:Uncharacterized protein n=1 Tax=Steinernema carpocapsae TaxID=34508 RepID=A0A4U5MLF4_STECR|nr:hypothetical protein L596_022321 [Steinernema carpocapsae]